MTDTQLEKFEKIIGYEFRNKRLLERALTHSSYCNEIKRLKNQSNERLEFLGDAVLEVTVSDYLFEKYPDKKVVTFISHTQIDEYITKLEVEYGFNS